MKYIIKVGNRYYYKRRVPDIVKEYDNRIFVRVSLRTDSKESARQKASIFDKELQAYWSDLMKNRESHSTAKFNQAIRIAQQAGFAYLPNTEIAKQPLEEINNRILALENPTKAQEEAYLGFIPEPQILLDEARKLYFDFAKDKKINKSRDQIRIWENPRIKAVNNLIRVATNKPVNSYTRSDLLLLRDDWIDKIEAGNALAQSANKDFMHLRTLFDSMNDNLHMSINVDVLFKKIRLPKTFENIRCPFSTDHIKSVLLNPKNLEGLDDEAQGALFVLAEMGLRISEVAGLKEEFIKQNIDIPHICIYPTAKKMLKTVYSKREIPIIGHTIDVFKKYPNGFTSYFENANHLSITINKHFKDKGLFPSENHTLYSLRHSFQDRLTAEDAPDRVQVQLMGHKFDREKYGSGASLEKKQQWLRKIQLAPSQTI